MQLDKATKITDDQKFLKSHQDMVNGCAAEKIKKPYRDRLEKYFELKGK